MAAEAGHAASGMKREDANELVEEILKRYQDRIKDAPTGKSFQECYDLKTITPSSEYNSVYNTVIMDLKNLAFEIRT